MDNVKPTLEERALLRCPVITANKPVKCRMPASENLAVLADSVSFSPTNDPFSS